MLRFQSHGVKGGVWRGRLEGGTRPARVALTLLGEIVAQAQLAGDGDGWLLEVALPGSTISDGVQTLVLTADDGAPDEPTRPDGLHLARLPLLAGRPLDEDLLAEMAALRAELELVKRELRRLGAASAAS